MTIWTAPDIASIRGDNSRPLQKIFGSLTEYLKDYEIGYTLNSLNDVTITTPVVGQVLSYDATNLLWINTTGSVITGLNASNLASGTVPTGRVAGSYAGITGVGTITTGTWSGSFGAVSGANLTSLDANNLSSGTVASARISGSYTGITGLGTISSSLTVTGGTGTTITATTSTLINGTNNNSAIYLGGNTGSTSTGGIEASWRDAANPSIAIGVTRDSNATKTVWEYSNNIYSYTGGALRSTLNSSGLTLTGSLYLAVTNSALFAVDAPASLPWANGPVLQGVNGWAFYSTQAASYRMGFRGNTSGTRYVWSADNVLIGSQPNDYEMTHMLNVIGTGRFTGNLVSPNFVTNNASPSLTLGAWTGLSTWSAVEGYNGYLLLGNTSDRACYLRSNNGSAVNIGANGTNTLVVNNGNIVVNGTTVNSTLNVISGTAWFSGMAAGSGPTVQNYFGFLVYVSSRRELKENIISILPSDGLDRILALRPVEFTMKPEYVEKANEYTPFDVKRGFIAQETAEVDHIYAQWGWVDENQKMATTPALDGELLLEDATPIYWNHDALIADLVASIQNIDKRLQQLETL